MPGTEVQISAFVSAATKDLLERHTRASGVKKGHVVEMALLHYLRALEELPSDLVVPPRIVVSRESGDAVLRRLGSRSRPTKAMRELIRGD